MCCSAAQSTATGTQRTQGRVTGSKRGAAAAAAAQDTTDAGATSRGKRRKTAAAASPSKSALPLERKGRRQPSQQHGSAKQARNADPFALDLGTASAGQQQEQEQQEGPGGSIEVTVDLIGPVLVQQPQLVAVGGGPEVPNFKAFRRKGQGQGQQQQQQQGPRLDLVPLEAPRLQGADIDAFLRWGGGWTMLSCVSSMQALCLFTSCIQPETDYMHRCLQSLTLACTDFALAQPTQSSKTHHAEPCLLVNESLALSSPLLALKHTSTWLSCYTACWA
jgi:hypothetical protein